MKLIVALCGLALLLLIEDTQGQTCVRGTNEICKECKPSYSGQTCQDQVTCPSNCKECDKNGKCLKCNDGHNLKTSENKCTACAANCKVCHDTNDALCKTCLPNFRLTTSRLCERCHGKCERCDAKPESCDVNGCAAANYVKVVSGCSACTDTNCDVCSSASTCVVCKAEYFLSGSTCTACTGGCKACTSASDCSVCPSGQYWDASVPTCTACPAQCKTCDINSKCTECNTAYFLRNKDCITLANCKTGDSNGCTECNSGYKLDNKECKACLDLTESECNMCMEPTGRRVMQDGLCLNCPSNCKICNSTTYCSACTDGHYLNTTTNLCQSCPTADSTTLGNTECSQCGATSYWDTTCKACASTAANAASQTECANCPGYHWASNCTACTTATGLSQAECNQCAAAKQGMYYSGSCQQYNCSNANSPAKCEACGYANIFVQCRECPSNSSTITDETECNQCDNFYYESSSSSCKDKNQLDCTAALSTEAVCLLCGTGHYVDNSTGTPTCKACVNPSTEENCNQCPGRYWSGGSCQATDCSSITSGTGQAECNACNHVGKYHNVTCIDMNCTTATGNMDENLCNACDGKGWNGTYCLDVAPQDVTVEDACRAFTGRIWNGTCVAVNGQLGDTVHADVVSGSSLFNGPTFYKNDTFEAAICDDFSTTDECTKCGGQYWDGSNCKAVDCSGSLVNNDTCFACPGRYYESSQCKTVSDCKASSLTQWQCYACRFHGRYYDGGSCKTTDCSSITSYSEYQCKACDGAFWNGTGCAEASKGLITDEMVCSSMWARVLVDRKCYGITSKVGDTIDSDVVNNTYKLLVSRYVADDLKVFDLPVDSALQSYQTQKEWCIHGSSNRYWVTANLKHSDCMDISTTGCTIANVRKANDKICNKCVGYRWKDGDCVAMSCSTPSSITSKEDCEACGDGYVYENDVTSGNTCRKLECSSATLTTADRCQACSISSSPKYLASNSACYDCPANCDVCDGIACTTCKAGYHWDAAAEQCTTCSSTQVYDAATKTCKTCPSNCKECSDSSTCTVCKDGYIWRGSGCISCVQDATECTYCKSKTTGQGTRWDTSVTPNICKPCPTSCVTCDDTGVCTKCFDGYYASNGQCKPCGTRSQGVSDDQCKTCFNDGKSYLDTTTNECKDCGSNCLTCTKDACTKCADLYYYDSTAATCTSCTKSDCLECPGDVCSKCITGYRLKTTSGDTTCVVKPPNCKTIEDHKGCTECNSGFHVSGEACTSCPANCPTCESNTTCKTCDDSYYLDWNSGLCKKCMTDCDACTTGADCTKCKTGNCFDVDNLKCIIDSEPKNCQKCQKNGNSVVCLTCPSSKFKDVCSACGTGCKKCKDNTDCEECYSSYRLANKVCESCPSYCQECSSTTVCTKCSDGYYLNSNNTCDACLSNCKDCTSNSTCTACLGGFKLGSNPLECTACDSKCNKCELECTSCTDSSKYEVSTTDNTCVLKTTPGGNDAPSKHSAIPTLVMLLLVAIISIM